MRYDRKWQFGSYSPAGATPSAVKALLIANTAVFVVQYLAAGTRFSQPLMLLELVPRTVLSSFTLWQLVTYMFLHGDLMHLIFNMIGLWMCGPILESDWGSRRFLKYYFFCGIGAGVCDVILSTAVGANTRTIGASGAIYGLLLAFGLLYPNMQVLFMMLLPMSARTMALIFGGIALLGAIKSNGGVSNFAHLGGMLFGYIFLKAGLARFDTRFLRREYDSWKLRRARKRFQVYMRKHGSDRDTWVN
jgi:membrane associated rhomboid family serine protease